MVTVAVVAWWGQVLPSPMSLSRGDDAEWALWFQACACSLFVCWGADLAWKGDGAYLTVFPVTGKNDGAYLQFFPVFPQQDSDVSSLQ